jgi:hypothetical protein
MNLLCINRCNLQRNSVKNKTEHKVETTLCYVVTNKIYQHTWIERKCIIAEEIREANVTFLPATQPYNSTVNSVPRFPRSEDETIGCILMYLATTLG